MSVSDASSLNGPNASENTTRGLEIGLGIAGGILIIIGVATSIYVLRKRRSRYRPYLGRYAQINGVNMKNNDGKITQGLAPASISYTHYDYMHRKSLLSSSESGYMTSRSDSNHDIEHGDLDNSFDATTRGFNHRTSLLSVPARSSSVPLAPPKPALQTSPVFVFSPPSPSTEALPPPVPRKSSQRNSTDRDSVGSAIVRVPTVPRKSSRRVSSPGARPVLPSSHNVHNTYNASSLRPRSASFASSIYSIALSNTHQTPYQQEQFEQSRDSVAFTHLDLQTLNSITPMPAPDADHVETPQLESFPSPPMSGRSTPFNLLSRMGTVASTRTTSGTSPISPLVSPMSTPDLHFRPSTPPTPPNVFSSYEPATVRCDSAVRVEMDDASDEEYDAFINETSKPLRFISLKEERAPLSLRPELLRAHSDV